MNSYDRQVVLLPLRWESHTAPESGRRPQDVINRQIVDQCDLVIGIFWTRIGTPTGVADSGTLEEIERVAADGKLVMLYFSRVSQDPNQLDLEQLGLLRTFKAKIKENALIEEYSELAEFHDKFARQLDLQIRNLIARETEDGPASTVRPVTDIKLHFADSETGQSSGDILAFETTLLDVLDFGSVPDYLNADAKRSKPKEEKGGASELLGNYSGLYDVILSQNENRDYFRESIAFLIQQHLLRPVGYWLKNIGGIGARDVYIDLSIASKKPFIVIPAKDLPTSPPSKATTANFFSMKHIRSPKQLFSRQINSTREAIEVRALQPQREIIIPPHFYVGALESTTIDLSAKIYADTLPTPETHRLSIELNVDKKEIRYKELLKLGQL